MHELVCVKVTLHEGIGNTIVQSTGASRSGLMSLLFRQGPPMTNEHQTMTRLEEHPGVVEGTSAARRASEDLSVRPFTARVSQAAVDDLRRRIADTRWPDRETVSDHSQGARLERLQALVRYWGTDYDWRNAEAKLNA